MGQVSSHVQTAIIGRGPTKELYLNALSLIALLRKAGTADYNQLADELERVRSEALGLNR